VRRVVGLAPTSTMRARPSESRWVKVKAGEPWRALARRDGCLRGQTLFNSTRKHGFSVDFTVGEGCGRDGGGYEALETERGTWGRYNSGWESDFGGDGRQRSQGRASWRELRAGEVVLGRRRTPW
jgi:hypothetical protein